MKKKSKLILLIFSTILLLLTIFALTDYFRAKSNKEPIFAINNTTNTAIYKIGGSKEYRGIGYKVIRCNDLSENGKFSFRFCFNNISSDEICNNGSENQSSEYEDSVICNTKDFEMRLFSDKEVYKSTEKIKIWSTLKYIGDQDVIEIWHASRYLLFAISDGKDFNMDPVVKSILKSSKLKKNKLLYFDFAKSGSWSEDGPDAEFWRKFYQDSDLKLPVGEYTITASGGFNYSKDMKKSSGLECELRIKVEK